MSLKRIAGLLVFLVAIGSPFAAYSQGASGDRLVVKIEVLANGSILIDGGTAWNNPDGCTNPKRIYIPTENPFINQYYAATLTAYSTDNYAWAYLSGCQPAPWNASITFPIVLNMSTTFKP